MNFYDSIIEGAQELTPLERGQLYAAGLEYLYYGGREPDFPMKPAAKALFISHRPSFDRQIAQSERAKKPRPSRRKHNGEPNASQTVTETLPDAINNAADDYPNASEQEQEQEHKEPSPNGEGKKARTRFKAPTVEEVREYVEAKGWSVDAEHFVAYYGSQGWRKANGMPLTNWKLAVSNWRKIDERFDKGGRHDADSGRERFDAIDWEAYEVADEEVAT